MTQPSSPFGPPPPFGPAPPPPPPPPFGAPPPAPPFGPAPPFAPAPQAFPPSSEIRPGTRWYWIAAGIGTVCVLLGIVLIVRSALGFVDKIDDFHRVDVPGTETIHLDEGSYTVYAEERFFGESSSWSFSGDVEIRDSRERLVELRRYGTHTTYDVSDHEGVALYSFHADETGNYRVTTSGSSGTIVAIGPGVGAGLFAGIGGGILLMVGGGLFSIITIIVVAVKRGNSRRRQFTQLFVPYQR